MATSTNECLFPELPGINTEAGLAIVRGKVALYRKLLHKFRDTQGDFEQQFRAAQADKLDPNAAMRTAHSLKGAAASIGATGIQQAASSLEMGCREQVETIDELLAAVSTELRTVIKGLEGLDNLSK